MTNMSTRRPSPALAPTGSGTLSPQTGRGIESSLFYPDAFLSPLEIDEAVRRALAEDLGRAGDVSSIAIIPEDTKARAVVIARKAGTIAGLPLVAACF